MKEKPTQDRLRWAAEVLGQELKSSDRLLEIGCGNGTLVSCLAAHLHDGKIVAIDRSAAMIEAAMKKNADAVASGHAEFMVSDLLQADADLRDSKFDKVYAVNVNLFWTDTARPELEMIKDRLLPGGAVYLFNQPPTADRTDLIAERMRERLLEAGLSVRPLLTERRPKVPIVCVIGDRQH
jgi:SAM-dependent methyltransferase